MKRSLPKRSNLFLMEMILAILFFALAGAVCIQLFVKARVLSENTSARNQSLVLAKSAASAFEAGDGNLATLKEDYPYSRIEDSTLKIFYDGNWKPCEKKDQIYEMQITIENQNGNLTTASIAVTDSKNEELLRLKADCYQQIKAVME